MKKMRVAVIGQGRSGRGIHGKFFRSENNDIVEVVCIAEEDELRRKRAKEEFGCDVVSDYRDFFGRDDIDLVVNASYSDQHYSITRDLLLNGFNVLSEKPFGRSFYECSDLIRIAKEKNLVLTAFHQTLFTPAYLNLKKIIAGGKLGEIYQINLKYSGFARRWDWQTLQSRCAGSLYNTGPHPIGQALDLLDWDKDVRVAYSSLSRVLTSGDADDCAKLILKAPGKPTVDIEVNAVDAFGSDYTFKVFGSKGTLQSTNFDYTLKYVDDFSKYPERPVVRNFISDEEGYPVYCSEKLDIITETEHITGTSFDAAVHSFYKMLYDTIINGAPIAVTPDMAASVIGIIEECHAENPLPVLFD